MTTKNDSLFATAAEILEHDGDVPGSVSNRLLAAMLVANHANIIKLIDKELKNDRRIFRLEVIAGLITSGWIGLLLKVLNVI